MRPRQLAGLMGLILWLLPSLLWAAPQRHVLPGGLTVIISENHEAPVVSFQVWVRAGSAYERPGEYGITHLIEHMIFKGSPAHPDGGMAKLIESLGGEVNAYTTLDHTNYHVTTASHDAALALDLLADAVVNASFDDQELAREKEVVIEELRMGLDDPDRRRELAVMAQAFGDHPYGRPVIGSEQSVRAITRQNILDYRARWYQAPNMVVVAVGDLDAAQTLARVTKDFAGLPTQGPASFQLPPPQTPPGPVLKIMPDKVRQAAISLVWRTPGLPSPQVYPLDVAAAVVGQGRSSRLWARVKEKQGLVDAVEASTYTLDGLGLFQVEARLAPDKIQEAWPALLAQTLSLIKEPPSPDELERARINNQGDFTRNRQTMQEQANLLGYFELLRGGSEKAQEYLRRFREVEASQVATTCRELLRPELLSVVIQVPEGAPVPDQAQLAAKAQEVWDSLGPAQAPPAPSAQRLLLPCGITLVIKAQDAVPLVSMVLAAPGGQMAENQADQGLYQLWAKAVTRGTSAHGPDELTQLLESRAAGLKGFASRSTVGLAGSFLSQDWRLGLSLMAEVWLGPSFPIDQVQKAKDEQLARLRAQEDQPTARAFKQLRRLLYGDHPYGQDPLGTPESLAALDRHALVAAQARLRGPRGLVLTVVGDVDPQAVRQEVERQFAGQTGKVDSPSPPPLRLPTRPRVEHIKDAKASQTQIMLGYLAPSATDPKRFAMQLWEAVLGGQGGRLFRDLRDRQSLAYSVQPYYSNSWHAGAFGVYMAVGPGKESQALKGLSAHLEAARRQPPTAEELERAKSYVLGAMAIEQQGYQAQAMGMAVDEVLGLGYDEYLRARVALRAVTPEQMRQVAEEVLQPAHEARLTLGR